MKTEQQKNAVPSPPGGAAGTRSRQGAFRKARGFHTGVYS